MNHTPAELKLGLPARLHSPETPAVVAESKTPSEATIIFPHGFPGAAISKLNFYHYPVPKQPVDAVDPTAVPALKAGTFKVLLQRIDDRAMTIALKPTIEGAEPKVVSVPLERIESVNVLPSIDNRQILNVPKSTLVDSQPVNSALHSPILQELRISELIISHVTESEATPVNVTLVATYQGKPVEIQASVSALPSSPETKFQTEKSNQIPPLTNGQIISEVSADSKNSTGENSDEQFADLGDDKTWFADFAEPLAAETNLKEFLTPALSESKPIPTTTETKVEFPAVKVTLPEPIAETAVAGRQTMQLRLEPEHLGPATLHIQMNENVLTAKVRVETPEAKAALEGSLDSLVQQLSQAGIKVEQIEVTLKNSTQDFLQYRQPHWHRSTHKEQADFSLEEGTRSGVVPTALHSTAPYPTYLTQTRVNLVA